MLFTLQLIIVLVSILLIPVCMFCCKRLANAALYDGDDNDDDNDENSNDISGSDPTHRRILRNLEIQKVAVIKCHTLQTKCSSTAVEMLHEKPAYKQSKS
eukprot:735645_1